MTINFHSRLTQYQTLIPKRLEEVEDEYLRSPSPLHVYLTNEATQFQRYVQKKLDGVISFQFTLYPKRMSTSGDEKGGLEVISDVYHNSCARPAQMADLPWIYFH